MHQLAVTVLGHDRPGIIARVTGLLAELGENLEDSSMTLLRGQFAMTLICSGGASADEVRAALDPLITDELSVNVLAVDEDAAAPPVGETVIMTVHGADRLGIVSRLAGVIAEAGGNITDLSTRLAGELYVVAAEVDLPAGVRVDEVGARVHAVASELGVGASVRALDRDDL